MMVISIEQSLWGVALVLCNALLTFLLHLRLSKTLLWITLRGGVQLFMLGWLLQWIFTQSSVWVVGGVGLCMVGLASHAAVSRCKHRFRGIYLQSFLSLGLSTLLTLGFGLVAMLRADPWHEPSVVIPLMGMIIGNSLNSIALALDRLLDDLVRNRAAIETKLSLGATRWEAAHDTLCDAVRTGLIPIINLMTVVGVVSLPGTMTGLLMSGMAPLSAVQFQFMTLTLIMTCTLIATIMAVLCTYVRFFNRDHHFDTALIRNPKRQEAVA